MVNLKKGALVLLFAWLSIGLLLAESKTLTVKVRQLTSNDGTNKSDAFWSPDGKQIAYTKQAEPIGTKGNEQYLGSIWIMEADGSNQKQISPVEKWEGDGKNEMASGTSYDTPIWSPDITQLLVHIEGNAFLKGERANGDDYVYSRDLGYATIDVQTKKVEKIEIALEDRQKDKTAVWKSSGHEIEIVDEDKHEHMIWQGVKEKVTKDSKGVFFLKEREDKTNKDNPKIIKDLWMRQEKDKEVLLGQNVSDELIWSPDKKRVAFITDYEIENKQALYLMNADGSNLTKVDGMPKQWSEPDWSPDGTKMLFVGKTKDEWNIWQISIEEVQQDKK